ncbi:MAG: MFS transporter [Ktedonobacteraceae bacterium]|nr:MFS transporter [Ktedonobacteraceae bacterium]
MSLLLEYLHAFGRFQRNARLYLLSNALSGVTTGIILVLYNLYLASLGYGPDFIGLLLFVATLGAGSAIFPAGFCVDRFGGKAMLIWASLLIGVAGAGQFLLRQPLPMLVSVFLVGVGGAFVLVVNAPFLTANSTPVERPLLFSLNIVVTLATTVLGEILGGILPLWLRAQPALMEPLPHSLNWLLVSQPVGRSYQLALLISGLIALPSFIPLFLLSDDRPARTPPPAQEDARPGQVNEPLLKRARIVFGEWRRRMAQIRINALRELLFRPLSVLVAVQIIIGLGAGLFIPYFNLYFVQRLGASSALFGLIDGGANAINALLTLLAPLLVLRIGRVSAIVLTRLISVPLLLIIGLSGWLPLVAPLYLFRQGAMDMTDGILQMFSMEAVSARHRGLASSSYQAARQVAWALTVPLGGLVIARVGFPPVFMAGALLYLLAIGLFWWRFGPASASPAARKESGQGAIDSTHP